MLLKRNPYLNHRDARYRFLYSSGQDLEEGRAGGTWLAISAKGGVTKFGALLNITGEIAHKDARGRGSLVSEYVTGNHTNEDYCHNLVNTSELYNSFNLITIEITCDVKQLSVFELCQ